ncbi:MAG TPA: MFS transporter [Gammaproteobacteria bacterium]
MAIRYSKDPQTDRTLRHSVRDAVAYAVMSGGGETYLSAFALFLKATAPQVALLATLPALLGSLTQLLSAWLVSRLRRRKILILIGASLQGIVWLPLLLMPLAFPDRAVLWLIVFATLYHAAGNFPAPLWSSLMGDLVPERKRGRYFGRRTRLATITAFLALVGGGVLLHLFDKQGWTQFGFVTLFVIAAVTRLISVYHLARMHEPDMGAPPPRLAPGWLRRLRSSPAWRFTFYIVCMQGAVAVAAPFFAVYMLRDLQFSYLLFMANTGMAVLVQFLTLNTWGRISDIFGNRLILVTTGSLIPVLPALWLVSDSFWYLLVVQVIGGLGWAGFSLSAGNFLFEAVAKERRAGYMAFHNILTAVAVFAGGMFGALLTRVLPEQSVLFGGSVSVGSVMLSVFAASALLRGAVALWFLPRLEEIRKPRRRMSPRQLVFRVTRFNAFSGLLYEVVTMFRRPEHMPRDSTTAPDAPPAAPPAAAERR